MRVYITDPNPKLFYYGCYFDLGKDNNGNPVLSFIDTDTGLETDMSPQDTEEFFCKMAGMAESYLSMLAFKKDEKKKNYS